MGCQMLDLTILKMKTIQIINRSDKMSLPLIYFNDFRATNQLIGPKTPRIFILPLRKTQFKSPQVIIKPGRPLGQRISF